jgi:hypothetical protein
MTCESCVYWKKDYGMWCFNGWSKGGPYDKDGHCHVDPRPIIKHGDALACRFFRDKIPPFEPENFSGDENRS